jgi:hypothetical protein
VQIVVKNASTPCELYAQLSGTHYDFVSVHMNADFGDPLPGDQDGIRNLHGATSCLGAMTNMGFSSGACAFAISDPAGAYGTALSEAAPDMQIAAREATAKALIAADRIGEIPELVWVSSTPGTEEDVLAGIENVVGKDVPIIGGSAADNSISGGWFVFDQDRKVSSGVVITVLFPSSPISFAYQNGYSPTDKAGTVTKVEGRKIVEIDHKPAMSVYSHWTGNEVTNSARGTNGVAILSESTMWPLGRKIGELKEIPFYLLSHPAVAHTDGSIDVFSTLENGEHITLMHGTRQGLVERAGRVAALARQNSDDPTSTPLGALMIYCGGCMLSVQDQLDEVVSGMNLELDRAPFMGAFTFGEQGNLIQGGNRHGNLMISCIVFG